VVDASLWAGKTAIHRPSPAVSQRRAPMLVEPFDLLHANRIGHRLALGAAHRERVAAPGHDLSTAAVQQNVDAKACLSGTSFSNVGHKIFPVWWPGVVWIVPAGLSQLAQGRQARMWGFIATLCKCAFVITRSF
jgi:hypothetical protein